MTGLTTIYNDVRKSLDKAYKTNAASYNLRKRDYFFNVGGKVSSRNKVLSEASSQFSAKLAPKYVYGKICKKISHLVYSLINANGSPAGNWHIKDLKSYFGSNSDASFG